MKIHAPIVAVAAIAACAACDNKDSDRKSWSQPDQQVAPVAVISETAPGPPPTEPAPAAIQIAQTGEIVDLLEAGRLEALTKGLGYLSEVGLLVRQLSPGHLSLRIPVGTYYAHKQRPGRCDMVIVKTMDVLLTNDDFKELQPQSASINGCQPGVASRFSILRAPPQPNLLKALQYLEVRSPNVETTQAAVLILSDNRGKDQFSEFESQNSKVHGIGENEIVGAMKLLIEAEIDIRDRRVWRQRREFFGELAWKPDPVLKAWIREQR